MTIARDKILHLALNGLGALLVVPLVLAAQRYGLPLAVALAGIAAAWGWEGVQRLRGEGTADPEDAAYGTVASVAAALLVHLAQAAGILPAG